MRIGVRFESRALFPLIDPAGNQFGIGRKKAVMRKSVRKGPVLLPVGILRFHRVVGTRQKRFVAVGVKDFLYDLREKGGLTMVEIASPAPVRYETEPTDQGNHIFRVIFRLPDISDRQQSDIGKVGIPIIHFVESLAVRGRRDRIGLWQAEKSIPVEGRDILGVGIDARRQLSTDLFYVVHPISLFISCAGSGNRPGA